MAKVKVEKNPVITLTMTGQEARALFLSIKPDNVRTFANMANRAGLESDARAIENKLGDILADLGIRIAD
ncbi:hypothetical protein O7635_29390 [Asanoa sp. WMMD1127]|uniref:hypothetical protein n=1 Tax=Asanoa sp. WMMD1127 TaxID=3016107 RepID=UPI002416261A|nr:hypothetical protein [Asanoa sp. WMMD1127]MDG4825983.1 hypothetical protein [Asanoa sp. WMMD1127]